MKVKTSVTLSQDFLDAVDKERNGASRSEFLEREVWKALRAKWRKERDQRDIEIINANSAELNALALEMLDFQADPWADEDEVEDAS